MSGKKRFFGVILGVSAHLALSVLNLAGAAEFNYRDIPALRGVLEQRTLEYVIEDRVALADSRYVFMVSSPRQTARLVVGIPELIKECHELTVMEQYYATAQGSEVWRGAKDAASDAWDGAKQVAKHPGDSAAAIGRGAKRSGRAVKNFFKSLGDDQSSSSGENLQSGAGNFLTAEQARKIAYELHLDAYTRNPAVKDMLGKIALKRSAGGLAIGAATTTAMPVMLGVSSMSVTISSFVISGALTPGAYLEAVELLLRDNAPADLYLELEKMLIEAGVINPSKTLLLFRAFAANQNYTPHDKAYAVAILTKIGVVPALENAMQTLAGARTVAEADRLYYQLQLLGALNGAHYRLIDYAVDDFNLIGIAENGAAILVLPDDYCDDPAPFISTFDFFNTVPAEKRQVWILGGATPRFRGFLQTRGVNALYENIVHLTAQK